MRNVQVFPVTGKNSMQFWYQVVNPWRAAWNFVIIEISRFIPFLGLKNFILRHFLGARIGCSVSVGLMVMLDIFHPDYISIGDDSIIGYNCTLLTHEFLLKEYRLGRIEIGKGVLIGTNATVLPGVVIGDGAVVGACALVNKDVPPGAIVGGVPAMVIGWTTVED